MKELYNDVKVSMQSCVIITNILLKSESYFTKTLRSGEVNVMNVIKTRAINHSQKAQENQ
jgi:hypothetical protein